MEIVIEKGGIEYANDCEEALLSSEIGGRYFSGKGSASQLVKDGLESGNLFIVKTNDDFAGFFWYIPNGVFRIFPLLHMMIIRETYRSRGIGTKVLEFIEKAVDKRKIFLLVADFNTNAKRFYEENGYKQVGEIPNLYRNGITEYLMLKETEQGEINGPYRQ